MTHEVKELLDTFDHLPEAQQREAGSEILRRVQRLTFDPMSDDSVPFLRVGVFDAQNMITVPHAKYIWEA